MSIRLNPYITFPGTAREAMEFYQSLLGGVLTLSTYGEYGMEDTAVAAKIMHGMLEADDGLVLMGGDVPPGEEHRPGNNFAVSLSGHDADALRAHWAALSKGGTVLVPLEKQMWGDEFGMCIDAFGIAWMINISGAQA